MLRNWHIKSIPNARLAHIKMTYRRHEYVARYLQCTNKRKCHGIKYQTSTPAGKQKERRSLYLRGSFFSGGYTKRT